jgi:hypothetical protein
MKNSFSDKDKELFATMRVAIVSPIVHIEPQWARSTVNAVAYAWSQGLRVEDMGIIERTVVHWARNELVRAAMALRSIHDGKSFTHFMWLDADHIFDRDLICHLARHFHDGNIDMVSALYFGRCPPHLPVAYVQDTNENPYTHYPLVEVPNCLCEVDSVGFGAVMTKREIFETMEDPWFHMTGRGGEHVGEDMSFCVHAKQAGFRVFLDGQYKLGHFADKSIVTEKVYKKYCEDNPGLFGDKIKVALGGIIHEQNIQ